MDCLQEPVRSSFCNSDEGVSTAYSDLITSSKNTLDSLLELQEVWLFWNFLIIFMYLIYIHLAPKNMTSSWCFILAL